jgi:PRC-barrel domain
VGASPGDLRVVPGNDCRAGENSSRAPDTSAFPAGILAGVTDLGDPTSYLELEHGTPVFSSDGDRIGAVEHVLADEEEDIFDGLVIDVRLGPGGHRFADATQVEGLYTGGALLTLTAAEAYELPEPSANPGVVAVDADDTVPDDLGDKLRRAWDRISGNY